ncbi:MAG: TRAP transporter small permease [Desulfuromonadales bacterium]|nr:TRAP transporter small permease [Desulfuromonadales bacterium]NIS39209.1 TRAP transporter small permease [Desulfuromonadales bacterium]
MTTQTVHSPSLAILQRMASILDQVTRLSYILSGLALGSMLLLIINEVVLRYFFSAPTTWSSDVNQWFFALATMLVLPEITRTNGNVAITVLVERLPHRKKEIMVRVVLFLSFLMCMAAFYITGIESLRQFKTGIMTMWINPIPKWWISTVIPFSFLLTAMQFLRLVVLRPQTELQE